jgi:hypothetical protein
MPNWPRRLLRSATGDDGTGDYWHRFTPDGRQVIRHAFAEARELGHPCMADEHVLLGVLRHGGGQGAALLEARRLDLATARAGLLRVGPTIEPAADPAKALRTVGVDIENIRQKLEASFGPEVLNAAERRVRRPPRWRGGHPRPSALCVHLLAKRSFELAAGFATRRGDAGIGPDHLLYGVLQDALDPLGTQLSRRSRRELECLGFIPGRPNPVRLQLQAHGIDLPASLPRSAVPRPMSWVDDGDVSVAPETVQASTPACWCCGEQFDERDLVRLGSHPEVGVCFGCARFLQRRAAEREDELGRSRRSRVRTAVRGVRGWAIARGRHNSPVIGRVLRRIDRYLP